MSFINSGLHKKSWPYKRGRTGNVGDSGCAHDFILICMLQSTYNATSGAYKSDSHTDTFNLIWAQFSDDLYVYTTTLR